MKKKGKKFCLGNFKFNKISVFVFAGFLLLLAVSLFLFPKLYTSPTLTGQVTGCSSKILYVDSVNGNDNNACGPWKTIQKAADVVAAGDTVIVKPGNYNERIGISKSGTSGSPIIFQALGSGVITKGFRMYNEASSTPISYVTIKGFEITGTTFFQDTNQRFVNSPGIFLWCKYCNIENNYIHDLPYVGLYVYESSNPSIGCFINNNTIKRVGAFAGIVVGGTNHLIQDNDISEIQQFPPNGATPDAGLDCSRLSSAGYDADGIKFTGSNQRFIHNYIHDIYLSNQYNINPHIDAFQAEAGVSNIVFEKNIINLSQENILRNGQTCLVSSSHFATLNNANCVNVSFKNNLVTSYFGIQDVYSPQNFNIFHNDFVNIRSVVFEISPCNTCSIKDNIFYKVGSERNVYSDSNLQATISNNIFYQTSAGSIGYGSNYLTSDPNFVNPILNLKLGNFHLQPSSPAINAGTDVGVYDDLDGITRPQGLGYDIGAYEYKNGSSETIIVCTDTDHDGYNVSQSGCGSLFDCNDANPAIKPGATEVCDGIDNNCVSGVDEGCSVCGNNIIESGEQCDGTNLNSKTCISLGYYMGTLKCSSSCSFNTANCYSSCSSSTISYCKSTFGSSYSYCRSGKCCKKVFFGYSCK